MLKLTVTWTGVSCTSDASIMELWFSTINSMNENLSASLQQILTSGYTCVLVLLPHFDIQTRACEVQIVVHVRNREREEPRKGVASRGEAHVHLRRLQQ